MTARQAHPKVVRTIDELRATVGDWQAVGKIVGVVPTMGAIHGGHLALVDAARRHADKVLATLFVNPAQFGEGEDFSVYPRNEEDDLTRFGAAGTDLVFIPDVGEVYPDDYSTSVRVDGLSDRLDGVFRPHFFGGVATVVAKLLLQTNADKAYFGEKDYQQLLIVRRMARDLDIPVEIVGVPTVREPDGLALSSRNAYLSPDQRAIAPNLHRLLLRVADQVRGGVRSGSAAAELATADLIGAGFDAVDYVAVCDAETLEPIEELTRPGRVLGAAHLGRGRLIDNVPISPAGG